ncbi:MAG: hypothetical protein ACI8TP_004074 [Acidimicrobiales bacterium]|jgi:uncharacterized protein YkwD
MELAQATFTNRYRSLSTVANSRQKGRYVSSIFPVQASLNTVSPAANVSSSSDFASSQPAASRRSALRHRVVSFVALLFAMATLSVVVPAMPASAVGAQEVLEQQLFDQLNDERAARGIAPVSFDSGLQGASRAWSNAMASGQRLVHSADGRAEIIARGGWTGQITDAWMRSTGHRNLIVDPNLHRAGVGVTCDSNGQLWATIQFYRADTTKATLDRSNSSPIVTPSVDGSDCGDSEQVAQVRRLYAAYFRRESDLSGLAFWVAELSDGASLANISRAFASSPEFVQRYGHLSQRAFVRLVYVNVLGREPDEAGYAYWISEMNNGVNRGDIMIGFSESAEFQRATGIS